MITEIAATPFYSITADTDKNRIYFSIVGSWKSPSDVPNYMDDWKKAVKQVRRGFTVLTDMTQAKVALPEIRKLHEDAQKMVMSAGLSKVAEVYPDDAVLKMQIDRISQASSMTKQAFSDRKAAELWLDS